MWFSRIISSFFGIRKKNDLQDDINKLSFKKLLLLFVSLNLIFLKQYLIAQLLYYQLTYDR